MADFSLALGALCDSISEQLDKQNISLNKSAAKQFQRDADAITRLAVRGILRDSERIRLRKKLADNIRKAVSVA